MLLGVIDMMTDTYRKRKTPKS